MVEEGGTLTVEAEGAGIRVEEVEIAVGAEEEGMEVSDVLEHAHTHTVH